MSTPFASLDVIPAFVAVMRHGSLSGAARALRVAHPTVRRHIEAFEAALGGALFTRAVNGLTPTPLAFRVLPGAQAVLSEADALRRVAADDGVEARGVVRLTCSRVVASQVLPPVLVSLHAVAPQVTVELAATDETEDLLRRAADIAIRFAAPTQGALRVRKLPDVALGFFASETLVGREAAATLTPRAVTDLPFVSDDAQGEILPAMAALGLPEPRHIALRTDDALTQIAALEAGLGVGITQCRLAARRGLVRVLPQISHAMPCWLVMHEDQANAPRIRVVFDHLCQTLPEVM